MEKRKHIHLEKFKSALATILLCFIGLWAYSYDYLQVSPAEIYFNHEAGHTRDAVTISDDRTPIVNDPEWEYGIGEKHKFAYIKSQSKRSIKVQLNDGSYSGLMHLLIKVSYVSGHTDGIGTVCNLFVSNFNTDSLLTLFPTGGFPPSVGVHEFQWRWEIYAIPVNNSNYCAAWDTTSTSHHFYTLLATPQAPMAEPWSSVLDYACVWASGKNTSKDVATQITNELFNCGFNYDIVSGASSFTSPLDATIFKVAWLISGLSAPTNNTVNCVDISRSVVCFCNALGNNFSAKRIGRTGNLITYNAQIPVNCIDLIGNTIGPTNDPFRTNSISIDCRLGGFAFHAYVFDSVSSSIWDATFKYDTDGVPDNVINSGPQYGNSCGNTYYYYGWYLPCEQDETEYINALLDDWIKPNGLYPVNCTNQSDCVVLTTDNFSIQ